MDERSRHRAFLNRYYGPTRGSYDLTRRFYLLGRDRAIRILLARRWGRLVEVGPGTGRNLRILRESRPEARYAGVDACDAMLEHARRRCPWARFAHGFAEDIDFASLFGAPPDVILFSYALSMFVDAPSALSRAVASVAPDGIVVAVDFGDFGAMPSLIGRGFHRWLGAFHVAPVCLTSLGAPASTHEFGPGRYYAIATYHAAPRVHQHPEKSIESLTPM